MSKNVTNGEPPPPYDCDGDEEESQISASPSERLLKKAEKVSEEKAPLLFKFRARKKQQKIRDFYDGQMEYVNAYRKDTEILNEIGAEK